MKIGDLVEHIYDEDENFGVVINLRCIKKNPESGWFNDYYYAVVLLGGGLKVNGKTWGKEIRNWGTDYIRVINHEDR
jgi:hypothetical protein